MGYTYTGEVHQELIASYNEDEDPFPTDSTLDFPPQKDLREEVSLLKHLFFPRCWNSGSFTTDPVAVEKAVREFASLCYRGIDPYIDTDPEPIVNAVVEQLPAIRRTLKKDVEAAYRGDPAAKSYLEVIRSYPGFRAIMVQRVAHELYNNQAQEYARELTEYAKTESGIDIHPGAKIGDYFFIDHGTGVVIGETATIGDWVRIYQNVTLGALHFKEREDDEHTLQKGYKRHPDIGDHVVIGSGSNILGPVEIGDHVSIGANSWVTDDIPSNTTVFVSEHPEQARKPRQ
ncbi:serine acetyltransferase [Salinarchaeum sp. IM2453]|uniref:serine O-acetyltransferase EpsC n=1 Tax=Salinarchaeum sp. IM2453 TaxID=2862870 RepID=UPI001C83E5FF|nr:serine O-acetyltransferase EpsC [Salinarchaeum sp. IM2453]QZA89398.1 serine acetyltransferase [Salinarchaeum sp. IM2453]